MSFQNVTVVGLGYIGLPTAAVLADRGISVNGLEVNPNTVETINRGEIHIVEPGLSGVVSKAVQDGLLKASLEAQTSDAFVIAVPTPFKGEGHEPDLSYVEAAARSIAPVLKHGDLILLESTSPVGTTEQIAELLTQLRNDLRFPRHVERFKENLLCDVHLAYCPERVLPGKILQELISNDRVVGGMTKECSERARSFYRHFVQGEIHLTDARTAELVKLTENAFRDTNIAFANEMSLVCEQFGVNAFELIDLANRHPRVNVLQPGPGVGGHCIAVDPWFIVASAPELTPLIRAAREVNDGKPQAVINKVLALSAEKGINQWACLGLSFKANVDDLRESPALDIVLRLARDTNVHVTAVEPHIQKLPEELKQAGVGWQDLPTAIEKSQGVLILVDHRQFQDQLNEKMLGDRPVIDTRGLLKRYQYVF